MNFMQATAIAKKVVDGNDASAIKRQCAAKTMILSRIPETMDEAITIIEIATNSLSSGGSTNAIAALERLKIWLSDRYQPSEIAPKFRDGSDQKFTMEQMIKSLLAQPHPEFGTYEAWMKHLYAPRPVETPEQSSDLAAERQDSAQ